MQSTMLQVLQVRLDAAWVVFACTTDWPAVCSSAAAYTRQVSVVSFFTYCFVGLLCFELLWSIM
jgi:hypothetical protein